jgi:hypothetical protein
MYAWVGSTIAVLEPGPAEPLSLLRLLSFRTLLPRPTPAAIPKWLYDGAPG